MPRYFPRAVKKASMAFWRSSREREARTSRKCGLVELDGFAVAESDGRIGKIGVGKYAEDAGGAAGHDRRGGEKFFFGIAEGVGAAARDVFQVMAENMQARLLGQKFLDSGVIHLENFGFDEGGFGAQNGAELNHFLLHGLIGADACVLVRVHAGVNVEAAEFFVEGALRFESVGQVGCGGGQRALKLPQGRQLGCKFFFGGAPGMVGGIDGREIPFVGVGDFAAIVLRRLRSLSLRKQGCERKQRECDGDVAQNDGEINMHGRGSFAFRQVPR